MTVPPIYMTPGTNFHDLNLDWLLAQMKQLTEEWEAEEEIIDGLPAEINQYFIDHGLPATITSAISTAVDAEALIRSNADTTLAGRCTTLETNAGTMQSAIAANAGNISTLQTGLANEITARGNADTALGARCTALEEAVDGLSGAIRLNPKEDGGTSGAYFTAATPGDTLDITSPASGTNWYYKFYDADPYEIFSVSNFLMASGTQCVMFLDANNVVLAVISSTYGSSSTAIQVGMYAIAPPNTTKILVQGTYGSNYNKKFVYRGMLSPYSRIMFGGGILPGSAAANYVWKYYRADYQQDESSPVYPFEQFKWMIPT